MPIARIQLPDGRIARVEVPEGTTPEQATAFARQAAGQSKPKPVAKPKDRSFWGDLGDSTVNALAGAAQGAASIGDVLMSGTAGLERGITAGIGAVGGAGLRAVGLDGAANSLQRGVRAADSQLARTPTVTGAVERVAPTKPGMEGSRMAAQFVGGAMVPIGPKVTPPARIPGASPARSTAQATVQAGRDNGVRVMTSDLKPPRTFVGKSVRSVGERVPLLGTGGQRAAQQTERVEAVRNIAREFGAASGDDLTTPAVDDVMRDFAKTRGGEVKRWASAKTAIVEGTQGEVAVPNTLRALDAQIAKMQNVGTDAAKAVAAKLTNWREAIQGKDLATIDMIRKEMGDAFKAQDMAHIRSTGEAAMQGIYGPLKSDMGAFIKTAAGPDKLAQWNKANVTLSGMADELKVSTLRSVLRSGQGSPEDVAKILFSNKPSLVRRLYNNTSGAGRAKAQAAILQRAIEKSGGMEATSPEKFITQMKALGQSVGVFFPEQDLARVEGLTRVLKATARAGEAGVMTNSGQQAVPFLIGGAAVSHPWLVGGGALLARAYESAPVRDALLKIGRTKAGSPQEAAQLSRLVGIVAPIMDRAAAAMNDNVPLRASAGESPEQQQQQQAGPQP